MPLSAENLYAIYQALSEAEEECWLVTQTVNQAIETHQVAAVLTNLPEESWATNLNNWNNGNPAKAYIWGNVSLAREYLAAYSAMLGMPISPVVPLSFAHAPNASVAAFEAMTGMPAYVTVNGVTGVNPVYMYYTMWNWLYVSEGSDWTWQAGPPNNGPQWFWVQPVIYDQAIVSYVRQAFSKVAPFSVITNGQGKVLISFYNNLTSAQAPLPVHLYLVISNGTANVSEYVTLGEQVSAVTANITVAPGSAVTVYLYAPVTQPELGAAVIPVSNNGLLIGKYTLTAQKEVVTTTAPPSPSTTSTATTSTTSTATTLSTTVTTSKTSTVTTSKTSTTAIWVVVGIAIVVVIIAVVIGVSRR